MTSLCGLRSAWTDVPSVRRGASPRLACAVVAASAAALLAGCSGDDSAEESGDATSATRWSSHLDEARSLDAVEVAGVRQKAVKDAGRRFMTKCVGEGEASVLLVSGWTAPMETWEAVQSQVGSVARVCAYDRLGIGGSGPLPPSQTFTTFAADIDVLVDELGLRRPVVVVGQSLGGAIAMTWATQHQADTAGVVLVDAPDVGFFRWQAATMTDEQKSSMYDPMASAADDFEHVDRPAAYPELDDLAELGSVPLEVLTHDPGSPTGIETDLMGGIPEETTSQEWLDGQDRWAEFSSASELVTVEGAGHNIQEDDPDAVTAAILAALAG